MTIPLVEKLTLNSINTTIIAIKKLLQPSQGSGSGNGNVIFNSSLDSIYPVGSIYMSVNSGNPSDIFGGTWEKLPDGVFIRNSGGNAGEPGRVQAEGLPNITGSVTHVIGWKGSQISEGALIKSSSYGGDFRASSSGAEFTISLDASKGNNTVPDGAESGTIYGNSDHVTPYNFAVYMWKRIA